MKKHLTTIVLIITLAFTLCLAQTSQPTIIEDFKPSTKNQPGQEYPMGNSQGYARFRIIAPEAQSVVVSLGFGGTRGGTPLSKADDGSWMGTTAGPLEEGFHYYHLTVDGGVFNDPGTNNYYGSTRWESGIEIPAHDQDIYALKDVPHGRVQQILFPSKAQIPHAGPSFTHLRTTTKTSQNVILSFTSSMAGEKMKQHGQPRDMPI